MKRLISALFLVTGLAAGSALAQPYAPNAAGVTMGHWHLNSRDVQANKKIFVAMGGVPSTDGPRERVTFPGVVINLNLGAANPPPPTGGTVGSVVNHVGFIVKSVPRIGRQVEGRGRCGRTRQQRPPRSGLCDDA